VWYYIEHRITKEKSVFKGCGMHIGNKGETTERKGVVRLQDQGGKGVARHRKGCVAR